MGNRASLALGGWACAPPDQGAPGPAPAAACAHQGGSEAAAGKFVGDILQDLYDGTEAEAAADGCDDFFGSSDSEDSEEDF